MSVRALTWALDQKAGDPTAKVVLMVLADHADEAGRCWPSIPRIAELCETTVRTVQRRLKDLEARGLVSRHERYRDNGSQASTMYALPVSGTPAEGVTDSHPPLTESHPPGDTGVTPPVTRVSPLEPSREPSERKLSPPAREDREPELEAEADEDPLEALPPITRASIRGLYGGPGRTGTDERVWGDVIAQDDRERLLRTAALRWLGEGHDRFHSRLFRRILEDVVKEGASSGPGARASPAAEEARTYYDDPLPEELEEEEEPA